jgi:hypothetical protein
MIFMLRFVVASGWLGRLDADRGVSVLLAFWVVDFGSWYGVSPSRVRDGGVVARPGWSQPKPEAGLRP